MIPVLDPVREFYCPNCGLTDRQPASVPNRWHPCPKQAGLMSPLLPEGVKGKVVAHEREDYVGKEAVQTDGNGRPIFMVQTTRDEGTDAIVFPDTAKVGVN